MLIIQSLSALGLTLASFLCLSALFVGFGLLLARKGPLDTDSLLRSFWTGLCVLIALLQVYHLFRPVDSWPLAFLLVSGFTGLFRHRESCAAWLTVLISTRRMSVAVMAAVLAFIAHRATASPGWHFDTGLYQASFIRWANAYSIVPGLANLHLRFGFNNSILLHGAALSAGPWGDRAVHVMNGPLFAALVAQSIAGLRRIFADPRGPDVARHVLSAAILPPFVLHICKSDPASFSTDTAVATLLLAAATRIPWISPSGSRQTTLAWITLLLATAVSVKLSAAPLAAPAWLLASILAIRRSNTRTLGALVRLLAVPVAIGLAVVVPWMVRGVILSGYPLFPSTLLSFDVPWRVPSESANHVTTLIVNWARARSREATPDWLVIWGHYVLLGQLMWILVPLVLTGIGAALCIRFKSGLDALSALSLVCACAGLAWLLSAPDARFGFAIFWLLAACTLAIAAKTRPDLLSVHIARVTLLLCVIAFVQHKVFVRPGPDFGFHPIPTVPLQESVTRSGLRIWVPVNGLQTWNAPLPSAPKPEPSLSLRNPHNMADGFIADGPLLPLH